MTNPRFPSRDHFAGCLVGQAAGDALGFPVEGCDAETCQAHLLSIGPECVSLDMGKARWTIGQYTDDTQLAREMLDCWLEYRRFDPEVYARRIVTMFAANRVVGPGIATDAAARRMIAGAHWTEAADPIGSAGNGTAMRAGPVGMMCFADEGALTRIAVEQGRITHLDPRCDAGSVAIAGGVTLAMTTDRLDLKDFVGRLAEWTRPFDHTTARGIERLPGWVGTEPEEVAPVISTFGRSEEHHQRWPGISPFVIPSVLWSLYSFLRTPDDFLTSIRTAIAVGGDVDSTAAMTGAMSGAHLGLAALPEWLTCLVNDGGTWDRDELTELAHRAHDTVRQET